jgi:hypothetical protein
VKKLILSCLILLCPSILNSQNTFLRTIGDVGYYSGVKAHEDDSGNIFVLANRTGFSGTSNIIIYKFDLNGNLLKEMIINSINQDVATSFRLTGNGFIVCGHTLIPANDYQMLLISLDTSGVVMWRKEFGGNNWDFAYDVECIDSNYLVSGKTYSYFAGRSVCQTSVFSPTGDSLFTYNFDFIGDSECRCIIRDRDSNFFISGFHTYQQLSNCLLLKVNNTGDTIYSVSFDTTANQECYNLIQLSNKKLILTGFSQKDISSEKDGMYLFTDSTGNFDLLASSGGNQDEIFYDIISVNDDSIVTAGYSTTYSVGGKEAYGVISDGTGVWRNSFVFGNKYDERFNSVILTSDDCFLFTGTTESFGSAQSSVFLMKTGKNLYCDTSDYQHITTIDLKLKKSNDLILYPNPANDILCFHARPAQNSKQYIEIIDISGRVIMKEDIIFTDNSIDIKLLKNGLYLFKLSSNEFVVTGKFTIQKAR